MARISLNIEAESAEEMRDQIAQLFVSTHFIEPDANYEPEAEEPVVAATQDAEPGERQAATGQPRFKRTKDEIERGLTIDQARAERAAGTAAVQAPASGASESTPSAPVTGASPTTSESSEPNDPFASPTTSSASQASTLTTKDVRDAMGAFLNRDGKDAAQIKDVLHQFKQENGEVVQAASQLQPTDYASFIDKLAA